MKEIIRVEDQFYILASSSLADDRTRVLKDGETFAVFDRYGDVQPVGLSEQGLYHEGTRFLSSQVLSLGRSRPLLLSSNLRENNAELAVDLTNPDMHEGGEVQVPRGSLHVHRSKLLWAGVCHERVRIVNYSRADLDFSLVMRFEADFADIFEVRGSRRARRGERLPARVEGDEVLLGYRGLDGVERRLRVRAGPEPTLVGANEVRFEAALAAHGERSFHFAFACEVGPTRVQAPGFAVAQDDAARRLAATRAGDCAIHTSNEQFNDWVNRSLADLHMMLTDTGHGLYPYAGVPWFSTVFGRDGIVTALQTLWVRQDVARGVLRHLAARQAREHAPERDAQPGKILHEERGGEMAALGEVPFGRYYGSVDSTPLFVVLAAAHCDHTGDLELARELWPAVERALGWIEQHGDVDGDGFVEYARRSSKGLVQQGWKDSNDPIMHADGELAEPPIALCEVQGYVYAAWRGAARMARRLGLPERAPDLERRARELQRRFEECFWSEELECYALALDGAKRPCEVLSSNPGHCLFAGIASPERARRTAQALLGPRMFSGWGIRTLAAGEERFDPMSYHNGSVWPHDNALAAAGMARYGLKQGVARVLGALFDASMRTDLHRLPELYCGFERRPGEGPTLYPVACSPQAWASAAVFLLLQSALGLQVDGARKRVRFHKPHLPPFLERVELRGLAVADARVDITLRRAGDDVGLHVEGRDAGVEVSLVG